MPPQAATKRRTADVASIGNTYCQRMQNALMLSRGCWWEWNGAVWLQRPELEQRRELWNLLEEFQAKDGQVPSLAKRHGIQDVIECTLAVRAENLDAHPDLVNLQNGVFNLIDGKLYPHAPQFYMTTMLPFDYDPTAHWDNWRLYLESTFVHPRSTTPDDELIEFVQEAIGYSLTTDVSHHVTFWCVGEGANGKGVLFHVMEQLAGTAAMTLNVGLLSKEQYQLALLAGKRIALCSEASATHNLVEDATIKALVSGDTLQVRQIRQEPFELHPTAKLWWAMNELPPVADTSEGFWRRMRVIPFNHTFEQSERILNLKQQLDQELPGIFNWAVEGLRRLHKRGGFPEPAQVLAATNQYREDANPVKLFVNEQCVTDPAMSVRTSTIYNAYKAWCTENTHKPQCSRNFKKEMERLHFYYVHKMQGRFFTGLDMNPANWP